MVKHTYLPAENSGVEKILVEFEMLIDVDFGVIKTIANYYHTDYFLINLLDVPDENLWLGLIHDNLTTNPVDCVMNPDIDDAEDFYDCLMQEESLLVYSQACLTNLYDMIIASIGTNGLVDVTILCKDEIQKQVIRELFPWSGNNQYMHILVSNNETVDASGYSSLFVRHAQSLLDKYENFDGKSIYLYECLTNIDVQEYKKGIGIYPHPLYSGMLGDICYIRVISLYQYDNSYFINRNYPFDDTELNDMVDEVLDEGLGLTEPDEEAEEYNEYLDEAGIDLNAPESEVTELNVFDDSEIENDISIEAPPNAEELALASLPMTEAEPDLSYLDDELDYEDEEEFNNEQ